MRISICATQVPFSRGGAEILVESLERELCKRGHEAERVSVPFSWTPRLQIAKSAVAWRLLDLHDTQGKRPDLVIATRFPAYLIQHPNKVVWLLHQFRQVYDLRGTRYSDFDAGAVDRKWVEMVHRMDNRALAEARALFAIARNPAQRLKRFNGLEAQVLYPPSQLDSSCRRGPFGDYVLAVGRLDELKRFDLLIRAMAGVRTPVRLKIAGTGSERSNLAALVDRLGLGDRIELLGWVEEAELVELYAGCLAVFYAPYDEDFGYATIEAFQSGKPVLTASDSGGVLEFVEDGRSGFVCSPDSARSFARRIDELYENRELASKLGEAGALRVGEITWDRVITALTGRVE